MCNVADLLLLGFGKGVASGWGLCPVAPITLEVTVQKWVNGLYGEPGDRGQQAIQSSPWSTLTGLAEVVLAAGRGGSINARE